MNKGLLDVWFDSVIRGDIAAIKQSIEQYAGTKTEDGDTALILAARNGLEAVTAILAPYENGHRDVMGLTALAIGVMKGCLPICRSLVPYEVRCPVQIDNKEKNPLILALELGYLDIASLILEHIDLEEDPSTHDLYLKAAVTSQRLDVVKYTLKHCGINLNSIENALPLSSGEITDYLKKICDILHISTCPMCEHVNLNNFSIIPLKLMAMHTSAGDEARSAIVAEIAEKDRIILSQKLEIERLRQTLAELHVSQDINSIKTELPENNEQEEASCISESSQLRDLSTMNHLDTAESTTSLDKLEKECINQEIHVNIEELQPVAEHDADSKPEAQFPRSLSMPSLIRNNLSELQTQDLSCHLNDFVSQQLHRYRTIRIERVGNAEIDMQLIREMQEKPFTTQSAITIANPRPLEEFSATSSAVELPSTATSSTASLINGTGTSIHPSLDSIDKYVYVRLRFDTYDDCLYGTLAEHILPITFYQTSENSDCTPRGSVSGATDLHKMQKHRPSCQDDNSDQTPLMIAAAIGDLEQCRNVLFDYIGKSTNMGKTALMFAVEGNHIGVIKLLMDKEAGKTCTIRNQISPITALQIAALRGYDTVVNLLLDVEAGIQDKYGFTALMYAAANDNVESIKLLIPREKGLLTNSKFITGQGISALVIATANNNLEAVKLLLPVEEHIPRVRSKAIAYGANNECVAYIKMIEEQRLAKLRIRN